MIIFPLREFFKKHKYKISTILILLAASLACVILAFFLRRYTGLPYFYLIWNLFLAWIPLLISIVIYYVQNNMPGGFKKILFISFSGFIWLIFYPNASYIVTDFVHLHERGFAFFWYDLIMHLSVAWLGLVLGFISLYLLQELISRTYGFSAGWLFVIAALSLSSFGIYMGRFLRWNSWDLIFHPLKIIKDISLRMADHSPYPMPFAFSLFFVFFSVFGYLIFYSFAHLHQEILGHRENDDLPSTG